MNRKQALDLFRSIGPQIESNIEESLAIFSDETPESAEFFCFPQLACLLMSGKANISRENVISALRVVEKCLVEGDDALQTAVVTGMVEYFSNFIDRADSYVLSFEIFFGPETKKYL